MWFGRVVIKAGKIIFEKAIVLKITIFPSRVRFLDFHGFNTHQMLVWRRKKFFSSFSFSLYKKRIANTLIVSVFRLILRMQQTATLSSLRKPKPATSNLLNWVSNQRMQDKYESLLHFKLIARLSQKRLYHQRLLSKDNNDKKFQDILYQNSSLKAEIYFQC